MVRVKVLSDMETRGGSTVVYVIDDVSKVVKEMYIPSSKQNVKLLKGKFYIISDVSIGAGINLKEYSKVSV